jgi:hypothetical protein
MQVKRASVLVLFVALAIGGAALADDPYKLQEKDPRTGTRIRRDVAFWDLPFDKQYAELSEAEKAKVRAMYDDLPVECEPPFPLYGLKNLADGITQVQKALKERGDLFAVALVDANGNVQNVSFYETPSPEMAKALGYLLVQEKFKPATCSGQAVEMEFAVRTRFRVRLGEATERTMHHHG